MGRGPTTRYHRQILDGYAPGSITCLARETIAGCANADFPLVLNIEPTNHCQLKCRYCAGQQKNGRRRGYMSFDLYRAIIDECAVHRQLFMLNLHKDGEPLLHPDIRKMIRYAKEKGVAKTIHLSTNGLALDTQILATGLDDITVSIDAYYPQTYSFDKGTSIGQVVPNVLSVLDERKRRKLDLPRIRTKIMETADNAEEVASFVGFWSEIADDVQVTGMHNWSGAINVKVTDQHPKRRYPCVLPWYMMAVNWDGAVSACNLDWDLSLYLGKLPDSSIQEIWQSDTIRLLRNNELNGLHRHVCDKCVVWGGAEDMTQWMHEKREFL